MLDDAWILLDDQGQSALAFTSFISLNCSEEGQVLSYPIEQGSFASYHKSRKPRSLNVSLGVQGTEADFSSVLFTLDDYKNQAVLLSVATPAMLYENMTLESHTHRRGQDSSAGMLIVDLKLVEVREVGAPGTASATGRPKNPSSAGRVSLGRVQARTPVFVPGTNGVKTG